MDVNEFKKQLSQEAYEKAVESLKMHKEQQHSAQEQIEQSLGGGVFDGITAQMVGGSVDRASNTWENHSAVKQQAVEPQQPEQELSFDDQ